MYIMVRHRITRPYGMLVVHLSTPYINKSNSTTWLLDVPPYIALSHVEHEETSSTPSHWLYN